MHFARLRYIAVTYHRPNSFRHCSSTVSFRSTSASSLDTRTLDLDLFVWTCLSSTPHAVLQQLVWNGGLLMRRRAQLAEWVGFPKKKLLKKMLVKPCSYAEPPRTTRRIAEPLRNPAEPHLRATPDHPEPLGTLAQTCEHLLQSCPSGLRTQKLLRRNQAKFKELSEQKPTNLHT